MSAVMEPLKQIPSAGSPAISLGDVKRRRVLLVAYNFPPVGGAGVQRPVKWVKYLGHCGWDLTVLTPENPSVPALDHSLLADVPPETRFVKPRTWEPSYQAKKQLVQADAKKPGIVGRIKAAAKGVLKSAVKMLLQPDPQLLWVPNALKAAIREYRECPFDAVVVTAPPYSSFYLGVRLKQKFGVPVVLDYRDEWDMSSKYLENAQRDLWSGFVQERMQRWLLKRADAVIATTQSSVNRLQERLKKIGHQPRSECIYNGYDPKDFDDEHTHRSQDATTSPVPPVAEGKFRFIYTGTLWNLTTIEPFVAAVERLQQSHADLVKRLEFVCIGRKTPEQQQILERLRNTACTWESRDYCPHAEVLEWQRSAHGLCLLLSDVPGAERVVPAKLFEYLACRKAMLALLPNGESAEIVRRFHPDSHFTPSDIDGIANWLKVRLQQIANGPAESNTTSVNDAGIEDFSRPRQTAHLARILDELVDAARAQDSSVNS